MKSHTEGLQLLAGKEPFIKGRKDPTRPALKRKDFKLL